MKFLELLLLAVGLSMDAFSVSLCKGMAVNKYKYKYSLIVGIYFGVFQAGMTAIGYLLGSSVSTYIESIDHWIIFGLLAIMGIKMIYESFKEEKDEGCVENSFNTNNMLMAAFATSVDALAIGISLSLVAINIFSASMLIGVITFCFCFAGVKVGSIFKSGFKFKAEMFGGAILLVIGIKILLEHLLVI